MRLTDSRSGHGLTSQGSETECADSAAWWTATTIAPTQCDGLVILVKCCPVAHTDFHDRASTVLEPRYIES